jgi:hypothetical protein
MPVVEAKSNVEIQPFAFARFLPVWKDYAFAAPALAPRHLNCCRPDCLADSDGADSRPLLQVHRAIVVQHRTARPGCRILPLRFGIYLEFEFGGWSFVSIPLARLRRRVHSSRVNRDHLL